MADPRQVDVTEDLPLHCLTPGTPLGALHPRVFLDAREGETLCPYCGTKLRL